MIIETGLRIIHYSAGAKNNNVSQAGYGRPYARKCITT